MNKHLMRMVRGGQRDLGDGLLSARSDVEHGHVSGADIRIPTVEGQVAQPMLFTQRRFLTV